MAAARTCRLLKRPAKPRMGDPLDVVLSANDRAVLYTHTHADHILGIDDLRPLTFHRGGKIPLYARPEAAEFLRTMFRYIFDDSYKYGGIAQVELLPINGPVELFGAVFDPVKVLHGDALEIIQRFSFDVLIGNLPHAVTESLLKLMPKLSFLFGGTRRRRRRSPRTSSSAMAFCPGWAMAMTKFSSSLG